MKDHSRPASLAQRLAMRLSTKHINFALLVCGFGLGQGSLFLANTYLYLGGHYQLVAAFGSSNAFLTLVTFIGDWGSGSFLAREAVSVGDPHRADRSYIALSAFRLALALIYAILTFYLWNGQAGFLPAFLTASMIGVAALAFNPTGLMDGRAKSGLAGLTQALPNVAMATALPFCIAPDLHTAGSVLGTVGALFTIISVGLQIGVARISPNAIRPGLDPGRIARIAVEAAPYMLTALPGHALFRGQVYLANAYLAAPQVALFIYARQIIGLGYQAGGFLLRVDLPEFAVWLREHRPSPSKVLLMSSAVRIAAALVIAAFLALPVLARSRPDLAWLLAAYGVAVLTLTSSSTLQRNYLLTGRAYVAVISLAVTSAIGLGYAFLFIGNQAAYALVICELLAHICQIVWLYLSWHPPKRLNAAHYSNASNRL